MAINNTPPRAVCTTVPDPEGRGSVLRVRYTHHLDGESLALKLYDRYGRRQETGERLPDDLALADLADLLGEQGASCAEGWHVSELEPTEGTWNAVWPWACEQVRRLLPDLSWSVEPERRIHLPWHDESGTSPADSL
ncbi:hypothetical protein ACFV3R_10055 [Streptomyces sp. NPDC059740]|uniref:hypothetical protein n=1 Tax=Streptomyces sp. NPDC059740 TaxID=3346926 RepID=UPI003661F009